MELYQQSKDLVLDLCRKQALLQPTAAMPPWVDGEVAQVIVEFGRDLLSLLVAERKDETPPIVQAFGKHRELMWQLEKLALPRVNSRDDLKGPRNLVKASWNGFVFAQFVAVAGSIFVFGEPPTWAAEVGLRAPGGFWISSRWKCYFKDRYLTLPDFIAQKCFVQFLVFRESYRQASWDR